MSRNLPAAIALIAGVVLIHGRAACANGDSPTSSTASQPSAAGNVVPASQTPDKWQFTLFNPAPSNQLRGMDTDRPNVTNTPHTVDAGHLQIETGGIDYAYFRDRSSGNNVREDDFDFGQFNFRLGVLNNLEINVAVDAYDSVRVHDYFAGASSHAGSFGDTVLGGKLSLWGDDGSDDDWATALAIQPQFKFPTGGNDVGNGHFEFAVPLPFLMNLPAGFHLGVQTGISCDRNSTNTGFVTGFPTSISLDRVVIGNLDVYLEYACDPTTETHVKVEQTIDVGGTYPLTNNIVLDGGVNFGLNKASTNIEALAGVSVRF